MFHKNQKTTDGYRGTCKQCRKEFNKKYWEENKKNINDKRKEKYKDPEVRQKHIERTRKWRKENPEANLSCIKNWREANREQYRELTKRAKKKRRERIKSGTVIWNKKLKDECLNHWGNKCAYCGKDDPETFDHVMPLSKGGSTTPWNYVPCCFRCNCSKSNKMLNEWAEPEIFDAVMEYTTKMKRKHENNDE